MKTWLKKPVMTREEWLQWRRNGIGSSDAASILGEKSAFKTPYQAWESIVFGKEQSDNSAMSRGRELEEPARKEFERLMDISVLPVNAENISTPWLRASLDGIDMEGKVMVEIKAPGKEDHSLALMQKIPAKYFIQCQHQLAVTGLPGMYYFSFDGKEGVIIEVERDDAFIEKELFPKEKDFWDLVLQKTPPALIERDYINMEKHVEMREWIETRRMVKVLEEKEKALLEKLKKESGDRNFSGFGVKMTKHEVKGNVDYKRAFLEHKISEDEYRKDSFLKWMPSGI